MSLFGGTRADLGRAGGRGDRRRRRGAARGAAAGKPGGRDRRSAAQDVRRCSSWPKPRRSALAFASYVPEGAGRRAHGRSTSAAASGCKISPPVAARIADACGNDQAIVAQELEKLALYLDASPQAPKELDHDAVDAVGADAAEGDFLRLADLALSGEVGRARRRAGAAARRRTGGDSGGPLASAAPADAGADAGPGRARRTPRRRHDVTGQVIVLEG